MSKAITTRYIGATDRRPARILASDEDGNRITHPVEDDGQFPHTNQHKAAAVALCRSMRWTGAETLMGGTTKMGMVWVFVPALAAIRELLIDGHDWREEVNGGDLVEGVSIILDNASLGPKGQS